MTTDKMYRMNKINPLMAILSLALILVILFWIAKSIFKLLSFVAPVVFIAALVINYRVVVSYGKWIGDTFSSNPIFGIAAVLFTIIGFPLVSMYLLLKAISSRGMMEQKPRVKGEYIAYEEVDEDFLDLSDVTEQRKKLDNDYNDVLK